MENIFESFTQPSQSDTRKYGGTGLGLTISQQFMQTVGGEIGLQMPEVDRFQATQRIRQLSRPKRVAIAILTASVVGRV